MSHRDPRRKGRPRKADGFFYKVPREAKMVVASCLGGECDYGHFLEMVALVADQPVPPASTALDVSAVTASLDKLVRDGLIALRRDPDTGAPLGFSLRQENPDARLLDALVRQTLPPDLGGLTT